MPKVSVIIATHSRPAILPRTVESAFDAGTDVEVIVVDDASTDETAEVCRRLQGIKYIRAERNQRTAGARNLGILASTAEFITFLDDDDLRLPGSLDKQLAVFDRHPEAGLVYGKCWLGDQDCRPTGVSRPDGLPEGDVFWQLLEWNFIPTISAVFRKDCLYKVGMMEKTLYGVDDYDMWIRIAELYPVFALDEPVGIWRVSLPASGQGSSDRTKEALLSKLVVEKSLSLPKAQSNPEKREFTARHIRDFTADNFLWSARECVAAGEAQAARGAIFKAVKMHPARTLRPYTLKLLLRSFTS